MDKNAKGAPVSQFLSWIITKEGVERLKEQKPHTAYTLYQTMHQKHHSGYNF